MPHLHLWRPDADVRLIRARGYRSRAVSAVHGVGWEAWPHAIITRGVYPMKRLISKALALAMGLGATTAMGGIPESAHPDYDLSVIPFPEKYKVMGLNFL